MKQPLDTQRRQHLLVGVASSPDGDVAGHLLRRPPTSSPPWRCCLWLYSTRKVPRLCCRSFTGRDRILPSVFIRWACEPGGVSKAHSPSARCIRGVYLLKSEISDHRYVSWGRLLFRFSCTFTFLFKWFYVRCLIWGCLDGEKFGIWVL